MKWYLRAFQKFFIIDGRASRKEYWMFMLVHCIIIFAIAFMEGLFGADTEDGVGLLSNLYNLVALIPNITVGIRRMHDTNRSGWWLLFPIVNIVLLCFQGDANENKYGPDPRPLLD